MPPDITLDISSEALDEISSQAARLVAEYFTNVAERQVVAPNYAGKTKSLVDVELPLEGRPLGELLDECRTVMDLSRHNGHPRFFGYVASPSTPIGAYADLIASALNANITCWRSGPAGTEIEQLVVRWLGALIRYDDNAKGLLTSGGSMANMIALLIASRRANAEASQKGLWNAGPPMTIYASEEVHMSIPKAADVLGFGRENVRIVSCDAERRMRVDELVSHLKADWRQGLRPICVVGSAGTVEYWRGRSVGSRLRRLRLSLTCGFTSTGLMARRGRWTRIRKSRLWVSNAPIPFHSIRTSGFTFPLTPAASVSRRRGRRRLHRRRGLHPSARPHRRCRVCLLGLRRRTVATFSRAESLVDARVITARAASPKPSAKIFRSRPISARWCRRRTISNCWRPSN